MGFLALSENPWQVVGGILAVMWSVSAFLTSGVSAHRMRRMVYRILEG